MKKEEVYYNAEIKEKYFETFINENTRETTEYTFKKAKETEELMKKDIYEMNIDELGEVIKGMAASTVNSAYNYTFKLSHYIDWATDYRKTNINPFESIEDKREWVKPFVSTRKHYAFTRAEILDMCGELVNYQDKAVLLALFEGITGKGFSELLNLRSKDIKEIDDKYYATLHDSKSEEPRTIEISNQLATYLEKADIEFEYQNKNGLSESAKSSTSILVDSPYIFKKSSRGKKDGKLDLFFVNRKFQMFKDIFEAGSLTAKQITDSGIMHMVNEYYQAQGFISDENWEAIAEHYNASFVKYNDSIRRNIVTLKQVASEKAFEDKYGYTISELV